MTPWLDIECVLVVEFRWPTYICVQKCGVSISNCLCLLLKNDLKIHCYMSKKESQNRVESIEWAKLPEEKNILSSVNHDNL